MTIEAIAIERLLCLRPSSGSVPPEECIELAKRFFEVEAL